MKRTSLWLIGLLSLLGSSPSVTEITVSFDQERHTISSKEDPQARMRFERLQLINPKTKQVPNDIRSKELAFSLTHPTRTEYETARGNKSLQESWQLAGPYNVGGRTRAIALDVLDNTENTILAGGVSGGLWKTTNGGSSWRRTSDPELRNSITTLVQDTRPGKENIWYYGSGELLGNSPRGGGAPYRGDGIFKSVDNGESWSQLAFTNDSDPSNFGSQFQYIWRLVADKTDGTNDVVLAAAYGGILRSSDGGATWSTVLGEELFGLPDDTDLNGILAPFYTDIVQTPEGDFYAYLSDQTGGSSMYAGGFYWSANGVDWRSLGTFGAQSLGRTVLDARNNQVYFFASINDAAYLYRYVKTGEDGGGNPTGTWTNLSNNLPDFDDFGELDIQTGYNMTIKIHPANPAIIFLGATNLYRSNDGFQSTGQTEWIGGYGKKSDGNLYPNHHPDQHDVIFSTVSTNKILSANDGGIHRSTNALAADVTWTSLNNGYVTSQFYTINVPKNEASNVITGGLQDNGSWINISDQENAVWFDIIGGDGGYTGSVPLGLYWYFSFQNSQIYRLTLNENLGLTSFARVDPTAGASGTEYLFINPYVLDPSNANIMYLAGGNAIWKNANLAQIPTGSQETTSVNWRKLSQTEFSLGTISALEITRNSAYLFYGTSDGELFRLNGPSDLDGGNQVNIWQSNLPEGAYVSSIASDPENADKLMLTFSNYGIPSIFYSVDAGSTFTDVSGNLEEFVDGTGNGPSVRWAEVVPLESGTRYFVGTSTGLYSTDLLNGSSTVWVKESPNLIGKSVVKMIDYRPLDGIMVVATHGNGVFRTKVAGFKSLQPYTGNVPDEFASSRSYPNPFSTKTQIEFDIPKTDYLKVDIYDSQGRFIKNLFLGPQYAGTSVVTWDGTNQFNKPMPNGLYIYRIYYDGQISGGKIMYAR
jgi:photosystem II stability/assembly factor-like uncharacterized protein